jgi:3'(2'), 5'-bisphosphate nucleotidase
MNLRFLNSRKLINIIEMASQLILQIYHRDNFMVEIKEDKSPLTEADKKANEYICNQLTGIYPEIPIISEENKNEEYENRSKYEFAWLIDPLDGTKEFISRNGEFTVNIGLIHLGVPVAGFVNIPCSGITYWAIKGFGAWKKNYNEEDSIMIEPRGGREYDELIKKRKTIVLASRSHMNEETVEYISKLGGDVELKNVGSSIKLMWIADNKADIYPRIAPTMEWDTCASDAILRELGGGCMIYFKEIQMGGGRGTGAGTGAGVEYLIYNKESLINPSFIARVD